MTEDLSDGGIPRSQILKLGFGLFGIVLRRCSLLRARHGLYFGRQRSENSRNVRQ